MSMQRRGLGLGKVSAGTDTAGPLYCWPINWRRPIWAIRLLIILGIVGLISVAVCYIYSPDHLHRTGCSLTETAAGH
ncbi:MAG: hypothetical protein R2824_21835 [Saprospiraceae bacterium]